MPACRFLALLAFALVTVAHAGNALRIAGVTGDIPQNVNFAVNGATLQSFLDANGVAYPAQPAAGAPLAAADVGEQAARYTVAIECAR
jgi:hypothetical protein